MAQREGSGLKTVLIVLGCLGALVLALVAGCFGLGWFGVGVVAEQVQGSVAAQSVVQEHIGEIEEFDLNILATGTASEDGKTFVFDIKGTKGSGKVSAEFDHRGPTADSMIAGKLQLSDGQEFAFELEGEGLAPGEHGDDAEPDGDDTGGEDDHTAGDGDGDGDGR